LSIFRQFGLTALLVCSALCCYAAAADSALPSEMLVNPSAPGTRYVATLRNGFTIQFDHRRVLQETSRLYISSSESSYVDVSTADIESLEAEKVQVPVRAPQAVAVRDVKSVVATASDKHLIDADLIDSVIRAESAFNPRAVSPKGAQGLMQLMPGTAARLGVKNAFDAEANVDGGTRYLRELLARYNNDLVKALAAYNAGPERVEHYNGVPPFHETRSYVARVIREFNRKKLAARSQAAAAQRSGASVSSQSSAPAQR
jgi:soluble lytic murein transglycosylase-like protein